MRVKAMGGDALRAADDPKSLQRSPLFHRRLRRPSHYGQRRGCPPPAVARKAGRGRAGGPTRNLVVQLGVATEELNRRWYQANTGQALTDIQRQIRHPALRWMAATLDGQVEARPGRFLKRSSCCPGRSRRKRREITTHADPLYQH